ncbi:hypothetical protein [Erwinia aphidicola]|uniref:hypothetical protein n=1 Tax=Erwinia aphidicola TaxID=68334 RepID=UPI003CF820F9
MIGDRKRPLLPYPSYFKPQVRWLQPPACTRIILGKTEQQVNYFIDLDGFYSDMKKMKEHIK